MNAVVFAVFSLVFWLHGETAAQCQEDWRYLEGSCYLFVNRTANWYNAEVICKTLHAQLVEVTSSKENEFITSMIKLHQGEFAWTGLQDFMENNRFVWSSSLEPPEYTNWVYDQPDDYNDESCVEILASGQWNDCDCELIRAHPVCEQPGVESPIVG